MTDVTIKYQTSADLMAMTTKVAVLIEMPTGRGLDPRKMMMHLASVIGDESGVSVSIKAEGDR